MEFEVLVAARDRTIIEKYYGSTHLIDGYPPPTAFMTETRGERRIWIGSGNPFRLDYLDIWRKVFPGKDVPLGCSLQLAYDSTTARLREFRYVQLLVRPRAAVLERWVRQDEFELDSLWGVFSAPAPF